MDILKPFYAGIDVGASQTKFVILDRNRNIISASVRKSGTDFCKTAENCRKEALKKADISENDISKIVSTGYGRKNIHFSNKTITEISCHAKGCFHYFPEAATIIDIGGQDNKIIKVDDKGRRIFFKMNRKCAAGTGAFLEEMSRRLDIPLEGMNDLAMQSENIVELGSYCTVFSATEVLDKLSQGALVPDIIKGLFLSIIKRVIEMDSISENVIITGGVVAHNSILVDILKDIIKKDVKVPPEPQFTGAIGASLYAMLD